MMKRILFIIAIMSMFAFSCSEKDQDVEDATLEESVETPEEGDEEEDGEEEDDDETSDSSIFKITSVENLFTFVDSVAVNNAFCAELGADINLNDETWTPIEIYSGTLDGKNYKISGLNVDGSVNGQGFFIKCEGATINDLTIEGSVKSSASECAGIFAGYAYNSTFSNCATTALSTIEGVGNNTAGIAGVAGSCIFENCINRAAVKGSRYSAGIVAYTVSESPSIYDGCSNEGEISDANATSSKCDYIGGIVAKLNGGEIIDCVNSGYINSVEYSRYVGGIVGDNVTGEITNSYNKAVVSSGVNYVGGIAGYSSSSSTISECYNEGEITGLCYVGGIVGENKSASILDCYNTSTGVVEALQSSSYSYCAGIVGQNYTSGVVSGCYNNADILGYGCVGGVVGRNYSGTVNNSRNIANITGRGTESSNEEVGGVIGRNTYGNIINCYNIGDVKSESMYAGGVIGLSFAGSVVNTYNIGSVEGSSMVGGVAGGNMSDSKLSNFYSVCTVSVTASTTYFAGLSPFNSAYAENGYCNTEVCTASKVVNDVVSGSSSNIVSMTTSEMKLDSFVDTLNANVATYNSTNPSILALSWVKGDDGYPTLSEE